MSDKKWTPAQRQVIENRQGALLVSAAAGSGKTAVLVERALRIIAEDGVDADRLLIVTFTNAAAAELRSRISQGLEQRQAVATGQARQQLRRQRMLLQRASICTADAFCLELVRQNFYRLDLPAEFSVGETGTLAGLRAKALEDALEEYAADEDFARFSGMYGRSRDDRSAGDTLLELYEFLSTRPDRKGLRAAMLAPWQQDGPIESTPWGSQLRAQAADCLEQGAEFARQLAALPAPGEDRWTEEKWKSYTDAFVKGVQEAQQSLEQSWDEGYAALAAFRAPRAAKAFAKGSRYEWLKEQITRQLERAGDALVCTDSQDREDRQAAAPVIRAVLAAEERFEELFFAAKKEAKTFEFSDIEQLALELLWDFDKQTLTPLAKETAARFHTVMVDEYQDTNALQEKLYQCLAGIAQDDLFLVGDVKQCIYRFRHAEPGLFLAKKQAFAPFDGQHFPAALDLSANFRSLPGVIHGVNYFFSALMTSRLGEVEYTPSEYLRCGLDDLPAGEPVYIDLVEEEQEGLDAEQVAWRAEQLVKSGTLVRGKEGLRPAEYGDICVLLRTRTRFEEYTRAFARRGIPCSADVGADLLQAPEVQPVASLLRALDNPGDDVQLAAVLTGPLAGFEMDLLVQLRLLQPAGSLYGALLSWQRARETGDARAQVIPEETARRLEDFCRLLAQLRRQAAGMEAGRLCEEILQRVDWPAAIGRGPQGPQRRERLEQFCAWVQTAGKNGLPALVRAMQDARTGGGLPQPGSGAAAGCVSIMTVHRSKGLEFPIVILADTSRGFNFTDISTSPFQFHPDYGAALQLPGPAGRYDTAALAWMKQVRRRQLLAEEMRILYVALTRARDLLCIAASVPSASKTLSRLAPELADGIHPGRLLEKTNAADWLLSAALLHPDGGLLRQQAGAEQLPLRDSLGSRLQVTIRTELQDCGQTEEEEKAAPAPDKDLWARMQENFAWKDPLADLAAVPAKVSVSSLSHKEASFGWQPGVPRFASRRKGLTGAQRGTAAHRFLQLANFEAFRQEPAAALETELQRMVASNLLDVQSAAALDKKRVLAFFESDLFRRMLAAMEPPARLLREFDFITSLPASRLAPGKEVGDARVLVQGVADAVLVFADHAELVDYKTDRVSDAAQLADRYAAQLAYYKQALELRLAKPITRCCLYSLHLSREVELSAQQLQESLSKPE